MASGTPVTMRIEIEKWPLAERFRIAGHTFEVLEFVPIDTDAVSKTQPQAAC